MMRTALALAALFVLTTVVSMVGEDGMATCQISHSFGVCHDALH